MAGRMRRWRLGQRLPPRKPRAVLARNLEITYGTTALDARRAVSLLPSQYSMCICINAPKGCQHGTHTIWTACPLETSRVSKAKPPATRVCESEVIDLACRLTILKLANITELLFEMMPIRNYPRGAWCSSRGFFYEVALLELETPCILTFCR